MSESLHDRMQKEQMALRADDAAWAKNRTHFQDNCSHKTADNWWDIGLQHNFPDMLPRGICLLCGLVISPRQWVSAGPGEIKAIPAHHLYPIVVALDQHDYAAALLRDVYLAAVDSLTWNSEARLIESLDYIYACARAAIRKQCERDIEDVSDFTGIK